MALKYDRLIIELQDNGKAAASISIDKTTLDTLINNHNVNRSDVIEDMIRTMEGGKEKNPNQTELDFDGKK